MKIANPIGIKGENIATEYLQEKGYKIIERNYRKQYGEVDVIATHKNTLVFIEVKTRISTQFGTGFEAITYWKLKSLIKTAQVYKKFHPYLPDALRIDAISVLLDRNGQVKDIQHMENISG
ncbi:MAG TPA: YraN family protein [Candidatus Saccharimonadales bacterium]|nr:YraN family protein [Candidatus Saccharimonadales bacterium]